MIICWGGESSGFITHSGTNLSMLSSTGRCVAVSRLRDTVSYARLTGFMCQDDLEVSGSIDCDPITQQAEYGSRNWLGVG